VYGFIRAAQDGWRDNLTIGSFVVAAVLLATFVRVEARSHSPLVPAAALGNRTMVAADLAAFLLFGSFFSFIFLVSLLLQQLLHYSPTRTGLAWLATSVTGFFAAGISGARLVARFGVRRLLLAGLSVGAVGLLWLARVPAGAGYLTDLLPALLLLGIGIGLCAPTVQIAALSGVATGAEGLASGLVETMREIGGAVGIAAVSTALVARSGGTVALGGFHAAFIVAVMLAALGVLVAWIAFPRSSRRPLVISSESAEPAGSQAAVVVEQS
jgi:predicted MFS family arabinose efflux permease